jgi:hypothetical protein
LSHQKYAHVYRARLAVQGAFDGVDPTTLKADTDVTETAPFTGVGVIDVLESLVAKVEDTGIMEDDGIEAASFSKISLCAPSSQPHF